jgi:hypothetical protein
MLCNCQFSTQRNEHCYDKLMRKSGTIQCDIVTDIYMQINNILIYISL